MVRKSGAQKSVKGFEPCFTVYGLGLDKTCFSVGFRVSPFECFEFRL